MKKTAKQQKPNATLLSFMLLTIATVLILNTQVVAAPEYKGEYFWGKEYFAIKIIRGKVANEKGDPLTGVTVQIKGVSTSAVVTNSEGLFTIQIPDNAEFLVFSYVGMSTQEIRIANESYFEVTLKNSENSLDDVVVIGYGTQKKINLTGSVSSISSSTLLERPAPNLANLLQGRVTGLEVVQSSAQPGKDDASLLIRGLGSFGASSVPLVIVDGVIGSISNLSPNDIENVTVLKDAASASIYGARSANGVILITTKRGKKGKSIVNYKIDIGSSNATRLPDFIYNSAEYMQMWNTARQRSGQTPLYTQDMIDSYKNATDRNLFPNFNWLDYYFHSAMTINHHLGISGGNEKTTYNLSLGYLNQDGILASYNFKRYNALLNLNTQVNSWINIGTIVNATYKNIQEPWQPSTGAVLAVYQNGPNYAPLLPDGSGRRSLRAYANESHNLVAPNSFTNGGENTKGYAVNMQLYMDVSLSKGLTWGIKSAVNYDDNVSKNHQYASPVYFYQKLPGETDYTYDNAGNPLKIGLTNRFSKSLLPTLYSTLTYDHKFGAEHGINVLAGYEQQSYRSEFLEGNRSIFPVTYLTELNAGSPNGQSTGGSSSEWALRSYFGRVNYDFKGKYLFEANARYDGTSRVAKKNRWGFFPSVSAGWRISEEKLVKNMFPWMNMKIRASIGTLGNQEISFYPYQDILSTTVHSFGSSLEPGVLLNRLTDKNLKWESTRMVDIGVDYEMFNGLFGFTFDWFKKNTYDILTVQPVPISIGLAGPTTNDGKLQNTGWEIAARHRNRIGEFNYGVNFLVSRYKNKLLSIRTPVTGVNEVGLPYNSYYMYEWIGIFQSQDEISKSPTQVFFAPKPGDLKIKDQNGDGKVDADDRITVKGAYPGFVYSFGGNAGWRGFTLSAFLQGVQGRKLQVDQWGIDPFHQGTPPTTKFRNAWRPDNPSNTVPALYQSGYGGVSAYKSTYHLMDASYLRLKNVNLSYTFSKNMINRVKLQSLSVYVSGENLITFTKYEGTDPERLRNSLYAAFPQARIINLGLDIKF
jgi:TonB-linked SusC/RagA family outer membrane protein